MSVKYLIFIFPLRIFFFFVLSFLLFQREIILYRVGGKRVEVASLGDSPMMREVETMLSFTLAAALANDIVSHMFITCPAKGDRVVDSVIY